MVLPLKFYVPLLSALALALVVLFTPASGVPDGFEHSDKIVHCALFALLAYTSRFAAIRLSHTAIWTCGFAVASEILQALLPIGRSGSATDALADAVGIVLGIAVAAVAVPRTSRTRAALH